MAHPNANPVDAATGVPTTAHEWDGIRELNNPLPRWWLNVFYVTIVWALLYAIAYPAIPLIHSATGGLFGWNTRSAVERDLAALSQQRGARLDVLKSASLEEIAGNPTMLTFARAAGKAAFADNCAACHGVGAGGAKGYPNLNDDDWLWGGTLAEVQQTIQYGIRSGHDQARAGAMPAFVRDGILKRDEAVVLADYVRSIAGLPVEPKADLKRGETLFAANCAACHGDKGAGNKEMGAPNLTDGIWLYGSEKAAVVETLTNGRGGVMPAWTGRLDEATIKALTVYVHTLGGGTK
ncbi:cytochrome-c oxidase, cbb3-type subunit III [Salinarimonas soli]|uniref:Cbb3-type cytochrome c oxidase subunit n=2 Tax=Salinarimonas soli TaxID=1638099 RepID=A0A5B2VHK9_9HYPH|nr:cytochrome-c oxidase, cbb3-type subunit III [Salinarimonas soli]KAA2237970.1 cytochrome-c oxidase, cbb3-type subunit III [Salinarimonas soli]